MSKTALDSSIYKVEANRFKNSWSVETSNVFKAAECEYCN